VLFTAENYTDVGLGTADSDPLPDAPWGDVLVSDKKCVQILIRPPVRLGVRAQALSVVVNVMRPSAPVNNRRPLH